MNARIKKGWDFFISTLRSLFLLNMLDMFFGFRPQFVFFKVSLFLPIPFLLDTSKFNQKLKQQRGKKT